MSFLRRKDDFPAVRPEQDEKPRFTIGPEVQVAIAFAVTFIVALLCGLTAIVPLLRPAPEPEPQAAPPVPDFSVPTAREAYVPAVELIRQQDPAAQLASGAGTWNPILDQVQLEAGRTGWTFHFFLPATSEMAAVIVDRNLTARLAGVQPWETPPALQSDQRWLTDSPQAVALLLGTCRTALESAPDARVEMRLSTAAENRTLLWYARVASAENPLVACEVNIDATAGVIR